MDNFANYDSDSDASGGEKEEETATEAVKDTPAATDAVSANATAAKEPETKKRRVLPKPGAAMSSALPSFLSKKTDDEDRFSSITESKETPPSQPDPPQEDATPGKPAAAPLPAAATAAAAAAAKAAEELRRKEKEKETTRQKNTRKQKMGQANFTVKDNRECPDLWRG